MSARLIETPVDDKAAKSEDTATLDSIIEAVVEPAVAAEPVAVADDLPDKYKGKSIADVVQMHQNAESLAGRQSSEVGELRKIVDDFIVTQSQSTNATQQTEEDDLDFLDDPKAAVQRAIDNHPTIKQAQKVVQNAEVSEKNQQAQEALLEAHPDTAAIIGDEKFVAWITASPSRTRLLRTANQSNDVEAMSEMLSEWKTQPATAQTDTSQVETQTRQTQQASTGAMEGGQGENKKVFRRSDLIKLKISDPKRYSALQPEIMAAYADKRVI